MIERPPERALLTSRWLMAPFHLGLVVTLALLMVKLIQELLHVIPGQAPVERRPRPGMPGHAVGRCSAGRPS